MKITIECTPQELRAMITGPGCISFTKDGIFTISDTPIQSKQVENVEPPKEKKRHEIVIDCLKCKNLKKGKDGEECKIYGKDPDIAVKKCADDIFKNYKTQEDPVQPDEVKLEKVEVPHKERSKKHQDAVDAIRYAYEAKRQEKKEQEQNKNRQRKDIDNDEIVKMRDEQNMVFKEIAKKLGCCEQTVINRYNIAKRDGKK